MSTDRPRDKNKVLEIADRCLNERLATTPERPASADVRKVSLVTQQALYEVYSEPRDAGPMGQAEDILRDDNIKAAIDDLPMSVRDLARDVLVCAHARLLQERST